MWNTWRSVLFHMHRSSNWQSGKSWEHEHLDTDSWVHTNQTWRKILWILFLSFLLRIRLLVLKFTLIGKHKTWCPSKGIVQSVTASSRKNNANVKFTHYTGMIEVIYASHGKGQCWLGSFCTSRLTPLQLHAGQTIHCCVRFCRHMSNFFFVKTFHCRWADTRQCWWFGAGCAWWPSRRGPPDTRSLLSAVSILLPTFHAMWKAQS